MASGLRVMVVGVFMLLLLSLLKGGMKKLKVIFEGKLPGPAQVKRADTLTQVVRDVVQGVIVVLGTMMILSEVGVELKPLLAAAGLSGLAVGFGEYSRHFATIPRYATYFLTFNAIKQLAFHGAPPCSSVSDLFWPVPLDCC